MTNPNGQNPAKPTGKRQLQGTSPVSTDAYADKRAPAKQESKSEDGFGGGAGAFPGEVREEMKKVIWPTGRQMFNYTAIVFAFLVVTTLLMWGTDLLGAKLVELTLIR